MFEERSILGDCNCLYQVRRQVVESDHLAFRALAPGHRTDQFRFKPCFVQPRIAIQVRERADRFPVARELNSHTLKLALAIYGGVVAWLNVNAPVAKRITPACFVCLLRLLDVAGVFEKLDETFRRERLAHSKLFGRRVDSRGPSEHIALQQVVNTTGEDRPVVNQEPDDQRGHEK